MLPIDIIGDNYIQFLEVLEPPEKKTLQASRSIPSERQRETHPRRQKIPAENNAETTSFQDHFTDWQTHSFQDHLEQGSFDLEARKSPVEESRQEGPLDPTETPAEHTTQPCLIQDHPTTEALLLQYVEASDTCFFQVLNYQLKWFTCYMAI